tara:strand:- start:3784 stop:4125 length:342 start_codon:yes stop_codon:yes gene_type:complete
MADINNEEDEYFYLQELPFVKKAIENFSQAAEEWPEDIGVSDVLMFISALYIKTRESMDHEELIAQLRRVLYLTESTIQFNQHKYPGRYPNDKDEAELKWEINDIFKDINETD